MPQDHHQKRIRIPNATLLPEVIQMIRQGHSVTLPLRGYSMRPFLEDGRDKALLVAPDNVGPSDAVLAEVAPGQYVLHRIVSMAGNRVTLRGDGNLTDEHCALDNIKAKAIGFYRKGRHIPDSVTGHKWRIYSWWWTHLYPIRRYLLFIHRHLIINNPIRQ